MTFTKIEWCVVASNSRLDELDVLPAPPSLRTHKPGAIGSVYDHNTMHPHAQLHHNNLFFDILQALIAGQVDPLALVSQHQTCNITCSMGECYGVAALPHYNRDLGSIRDSIKYDLLGFDWTILSGQGILSI